MNHTATGAINGLQLSCHESPPHQRETPSPLFALARRVSFFSFLAVVPRGLRPCAVRRDKQIFVSMRKCRDLDTARPVSGVLGGGVDVEILKGLGLELMRQGVAR